MKLKRIVEDFQVEERVALAAGGGPLAFYRLTKQSLGTLEALDAIQRRWRLDRRQIACAGLKDKHALTRQYVTIEGGPPRGLSQENLSLEYLSQVARPIHASDITANAFVVVVRDLNEAEAAAATAALAAVARAGVANYFDDQRFGSLGEAGQFIAEPWCRGDYERALWLALADPNARDRPADRDQKHLLRQHWGDWRTCRQRLAAGTESQRIAAFLESQAGNFRRAIAMPRQELRSLWLAAFQSHLWNQILAALLRDSCQPPQLALTTIGRRELPFFTHLTEGQSAVLQKSVLPLPSARLHLEPGPLQELYDRVLAAESLALREIRVKYPRDSFFSKGERPALLVPQEVDHAAAADDLYYGRQKVTLRFALPRGCYATIVVKQITGTSADELAPEDDD
jgi:tRNA pseudouridine13 synthase